MFLEKAFCVATQHCYSVKYLFSTIFHDTTSVRLREFHTTRPHANRLDNVLYRCTEYLGGECSKRGDNWVCGAGRLRGSMSALGLAKCAKHENLTESAERRSTSVLLPSTCGRAPPSTLPVRIAINASTQPAPLCCLCAVR